MEKGDVENSIKWFRKAAQSGVPSYVFQLAVALAKVGQFDEASTVLLQAAENGSDDAMVYLGRIAEESENIHEARSWYLKAAELGHEEAKAMLSKFEE
jgi:TPR repeat protein